jgi:hypothetical protein
MGQYLQENFYSEKVSTLVPHWRIPGGRGRRWWNLVNVNALSCYSSTVKETSAPCGLLPPRAFVILRWALIAESHFPSMHSRFYFITVIPETAPSGWLEPESSILGTESENRRLRVTVSLKFLQLNAPLTTMQLTRSSLNSHFDYPREFTCLLYKRSID